MLSSHPTLTIYISIPAVCIKQVKTRRTMHVRSLNKLFPMQPKKFLYAGIEMDDNKTLDFYGISENDNIIALPTNFSQRNYYMDRSTLEAFEERIETNFNKNTKFEAAKLRDIQLSKLEVKTRTYNKLIKNYLNYESSKIVEKTEDCKYTLEEAETPAVEPLPCFWQVNVRTDDDGEELKTEPQQFEEGYIQNIKKI